METRSNQEGRTKERERERGVDGGGEGGRREGGREGDWKKAASMSTTTLVAGLRVADEEQPIRGELAIAGGCCCIRGWGETDEPPATGGQCPRPSYKNGR